MVDYRLQHPRCMETSLADPDPGGLKIPDETESRSGSASLMETTSRIQDCWISNKTGKLNRI